MKVSKEFVNGDFPDCPEKQALMDLCQSFRREFNRLLGDLKRARRQIQESCTCSGVTEQKPHPTLVGFYVKERRCSICKKKDV